MIGASKILTVSYGTFSCTLEGFDDPFNTMKAIAEYFRDLAAEDRYFGAEPPQPDAAMLHRIAEREIQRRVEARVGDNGVVLRAAEAPAPELPVSELPAPAAAAPAAEPPAPAPVPEPTVAEAPVMAEAPAVAAPEPAPVTPLVSEVAAALLPPVTPDIEADQESFASLPTLKPAMPEGVAAKLARLRRAVAETAAAPVAVEPAPVDLEHFEDEHAFDQGLDAEWPATEGFGTPEEIAELAPMAELVEEAAAPEAEPEPAPEAQPEPDPELEADLAEARTEPEQEFAATEAEDADEALIKALAEWDDDTRTEPAPAVEAKAEDSALDAALAEALATPAETPTESSVETAQLASDPFADETGLEDDPSLYDLSEPPALALPEAEMLGDLNDDLPEELAEPVAVLPDDLAVAPVEAPEEPLVLQAAILPEAPAPAEEPTETESPSAVAERAQRARARVIKIRRADATPSESVSEEPAAPEAALPPAAESEADVARLMRQASDEMAGAENKRRLSAIQHLKAAVAATVADRRAGIAQPSEDIRSNPYRADLARVVRPVRPRSAEAPAEARARRPEIDPVLSPDRPAPLVLVSELRVDRPANAPQPVAPVRPRRVTGGPAALGGMAALASSEDEDADPVASGRDADEALVAALQAETATDMADDDEAEDMDEPASDTRNIFADARDFSEFAEQLGAQALPELLEAAAAYATCVENRAHFTRPFLMRRLAAAPMGAEISREDGLRSFGALLRSGRLEKVRRGQYALSEDSAILAEARRLAG